MGNIKNEALLIFRNSLDSYLILQNSDNNALQQIISESMTFLLKNNNIEEILKRFNPNYFDKLQKARKSFNFFLGIFEASDSSNETLMEFLVLYENKLIEEFRSEDANFNKEQFYHSFIEKNLDLSSLNLNKIHNYMEKLGVKDKIETRIS